MEGTNEHPAKTYIDRAVKLSKEIADQRIDLRAVYDEAKEAGFTKGAIRIVVKRELEDDELRAAREAIESEAEQIMAALGMLGDTPLGEAAVAAAKPKRRPGRPRKANGAQAAIISAQAHLGA